MKIGVIGAMQMEVDELKMALSETKVETYSGVHFVCGKMEDVEVVAAVCGIGKVFAAVCAQTMILKFGVDMVINIGVAGSLTKELGVLDVALADKVCQHDMDTSPIGDPVGLLSGINMIYLPCSDKMRGLMEECLKEQNVHYAVGPVASGDQFIASEEKKEWIRRHFEAIAAEMEGASIGHVCYINQVPFLVLRSISDSDGGAMDYQTFAEKAALQSIEVVIRFIKRAAEYFA
ncbi:MAG: 5'-methylthioadenosine/adenosylhomocysteine nucleosidase [Lachnospiraceae bacterium]|nr:5'-methylthioadenosine/adenosylhomocysteine nucleosidase [Lachnospiraceae bacterium]